MEENTMSKNDAEESRSVSEGVERSAGSGQEQEEARNDSNSAGQAEAERRTVRSRQAQSGSRTSQTSAGSTRAAGSRRTAQTGAARGTGSRRVNQAAGEERPGSRRVSQTAGEERTGSRRASQAVGAERTATRRASQNTGAERAASHRTSQAEDTRPVSSNRSAKHDGRSREDQIAIRRSEQLTSEQAKSLINNLEKEGSRARERETRSGKFGLGHKKTRRSPVSYFFEDIAEAFVRAKNWCVRNYRMSIPAAICVVLVIVVACILVRNFRMQPTPVSENADALAGEYPLEQDAYEHVNSFFQRYYEASTYGDVETYASMRSYTDVTERIRMQKKANYIDYYQNLSCYTKPGPVENSYLVYVYYEVKFRGINTVAPGLKSFYLCTNDAGELYVFSGDVDQNVIDYMRIASTQEDVKDLFNRVKVMYNNAVASDKELKDFLSTLADNLLTEVELALMEQETQSQDDENGDGNGEAAEPDPESEEPETTPEVEPESEPQTDRVMTIDRVNVRSSASPEATKLGTVAAGTQFTRYETLENGWSKIDYEGSEAYIKTEFLQVVEAAIGKVKAIDSVNIRASASEDATKLGTVSAGTTLDLIENQENGWSRILFNGSVAYVKTEFLDTANMTQ